MLKASSKRRRTQKQIEADKADKEKKDLETASKLAQFAQMEQRVLDLDQ